MANPIANHRVGDNIHALDYSEEEKKEKREIIRLLKQIENERMKQLRQSLIQTHETSVTKSEPVRQKERTIRQTIQKSDTTKKNRDPNDRLSTPSTHPMTLRSSCVLPCSSEMINNKVGVSAFYKGYGR